LRLCAPVSPLFALLTHPPSTSHLRFGLYLMDPRPPTQRKGLRRLLKPRTSTGNSPKPDNSSSSHKGKAPDTRDNDTQRTIARHQEACKLLLSCFPRSQQGEIWDFLDFSQLEGETATFDDKFSAKVHEILESRKGEIKDSSSWSKCCQTAEYIFAALIPFSKNFFSIARASQSVGPPHHSEADMQINALNPYGILCTGLLVLVTASSLIHPRKLTGRLRKKRLEERKNSCNLWITSIPNSAI